MLWGILAGEVGSSGTLFQWKPVTASDSLQDFISLNQHITSYVFFQYNGHLQKRKWEMANTLRYVCDELTESTRRGSLTSEQYLFHFSKDL